MLMEVSQALTGTLNLPAGLYGVLEVLERRCGAVRGAVTLLEEESGLLVVEASLGYPAGRSRVRYRMGEGITGAVAESGAPAVVPKVSREPRFLHRAADRAQRTEETTFLCVPIVLDGATAGTLGIELAWHPDREPERWIKALRIAGAMISQALRIQRLIDLERRKLVEENTQLRAGAAGALRVHPPPGQQRADAPGVRADRAGRGHRRHRARPGRIGHRQGAHRPRAAPPLAAGGKALRPGQLRRAAGDAGRVRAVRPRAGRVHRRAGAPQGHASSWPTAARSSSTRSAS